MAVQPQYLQYVLEQLQAVGALRSNRMFGGVGLYADGLFFGLIDDDTLFFKTDDSNARAYRERGMPKFMPFPDRPEAVMGYHQVPADVIEDAEVLVTWARQSVAVALAAKARKPARARTRPKPLIKAKSAQGKSIHRKSSPGKPAQRKPLKRKPASRKPARKKSRR
jgi:DNA transformation protein and related proteins